MSQPKREPINRYRPLTQGEARALGGGLMRVPTKEEANKGDYVEYSEYQQLAADHAALVQQGIRDHADWRSKLNFLEADYKAEISRLTAENKAIIEERDFLRKAGNYCVISSDYIELKKKYAALAAENERLKERVAFLEAADRFKIWNKKTGEWEIRFSISTNGKPPQ